MRRELCEVRRLEIPYREVRELLLPNSLRILQPAAEAGYRSGGEALATLEADLVGLHFERQVLVSVGVFKQMGPPKPILRLPIRWLDAAEADRYPFMDATLEIYPIGTTATNLSIQGTYEPPFGRIGEALDRLMLHRIAEDSLSSFLDDVAARIVDLWHDPPEA